MGSPLSKSKAFIPGLWLDVRGIGIGGEERLDQVYRLERPSELVALIGEWMLAAFLRVHKMDAERLASLAAVEYWKVTVSDG